MKRTTIFLTENQKVKLKEESNKSGLSMSELIRRFIDDKLSK